MEVRPYRGGGLSMREAQGLEIEFIDEGFAHSHRIVSRDIVFQSFRKEQRLPVALASDETLRRAAQCWEAVHQITQLPRSFGAKLSYLSLKALVAAQSVSTELTS